MKIVDTELTAKVAYEVNRAYCATIGDNSFSPWIDAPDWQRDTIRNGILFHQRNPGAGPKEAHENWFTTKKAEGWKFGSVKDIEKKLHPCMMSYELLPMFQRTKDLLFIAVVKSLL